jgi:hypothetical protein
MEIILHGQQDWQKTKDSLLEIIQMLHDKYHIEQLKEVHLSLTLVDQQGFDVELIDSETQQAYRILEVFRNNQEYLRIKQSTPLTLVVDNTKISKKV